ncbi:MAG: cysteine desulfurase [Oscillospiraceae bacterium]|nr:cysteine desulfurase [Oscillospiraceae bacterium]
MYYFDNAATTKVLKEVADEARDCMLNLYGNPSSLHKLGLEAENKMTASRKTIADVFGCKEKEIIFTSGATESTNIAIFGAAKKGKRKGNKIITTEIEHASVKHCIDELENMGFCIVRIKSRDGRYYAEDIIDAVDEDTILVSVMHVNNENGLILPIEKIATGVKNKNNDVVVHVDGVQSFCKLPMDLSKSKIDLMSVSGHKINAPKGIGALYIRDGVKIPPHSFGGDHELGIRPGTEALPLIAAFASAAKINMTNMQKSIEHYKELKSHLLSRIKDNDEIKLNSKEDSVPYIVNISIEGIGSEIMLHFLESKGFCVSSGSACSKSKKSGVLPHMGYSRERELTAIRISFSTENSKEQLDMLIDAILQGQENIMKK